MSSRRNHRFILNLVLTFLFATAISSSAFAAQFIVFNKAYARESGKPKLIADTFTVLNPQAKWLMSVSELSPSQVRDDGKDKGKKDDRYRDNEETNFNIYLNGREIFKSRRCDNRTHTLEAQVFLKSSNAIIVELRGKPGSRILVQIKGVDTTAPTIKWVTPLAGQFLSAQIIPAQLQIEEDISGFDRGSFQVSLDNVLLLNKFSGFTKSALLANLSANLDITEGAHTLKAQIKNYAGLTASQSVSFTVDRTDPNLKDQDADGFTPNSGDCNDHNANINPNALDVPGDGIDQNCDGVDSVRVPNIVGFIQGAAESAITAANLQVGIVTSDNHDTVPSGKIISQSPVAGEIVPQGTIVGFMISLGPVTGASIRTEPTSITRGQSAALSWQCINADTCTILPDIGSVALNGAMSVSPTKTTTYTITATGAIGTATGTATLTVVIPPPTASLNIQPTSITHGESAILRWQSTDADTCTITPDIGSVPVNGTMSVSPTTTTTYTILATGPSGTDTKSVTLDVSAIKPVVTISANPPTVQSGASTNLTWTSTNATSLYIDNGIGLVAASGTMSIAPKATTIYTITATGTLGSVNEKLTVYVAGAPAAQPEGTFGAQYAEIIPADATVKEYDAKRFAIIHGEVRDKNNSPLSQVSIVVNGNPQYGTASTDSNGQFSLPVDLNGTLNIGFQKEGFLTIHRQVSVAGNDVAIAETIIMLAEDTKATAVTLNGNPASIVVHQSTPVIDASGTRQANVVITGDNKAYAVDEHGNDMFELTKLNVRATEFSTPKSMPAALPPTSAFTYCMELKTDGVDRVRFKDPVVVYVDNFLGFNVGEIVPVGYYDRDRGVWVPSENGRVVKLLDMDGDGIVDAIDANGDGAPDDLNANGNFSDEVKGLNDPVKYAPGKTFWRVSLTHFTPWDFNWPMIPPTGAIPPNATGTPVVDQQKDPCKDNNKVTNSYINCRSRIYHEDIQIPGTDITLHYASNRVPAYKTIITVPASGSTVPPELKRIVVRLVIAGRTFEQTLPASANQTAEFSWDGKDYLGQSVDSAFADITTEFVYTGTYAGFGAGFDRSATFGLPGTIGTPVVARGEFIFSKVQNSIIHNQSQTREGLAQGWTLSNHHYMSSSDVTTLYKGDGDIVSNNGLYIISTIAGTGGFGFSGDGGPATEAWMIYPRGVVVDQNGNIYVVDSGNQRIRKIDANGIITTIAGTGDMRGGYSGDGGPATAAQLSYSQGVAVDQNGNIYVVDSGNQRIRKIDSSGIITTIAGTGTGGYSGDGGPATAAMLFLPTGVAVDQNGNIYIADTWNNRIRRIDSNGIITTIAGTGPGGYGAGRYSGDGGPATAASINYPQGIVVDQNGNIYFADQLNHRIRKIDSNGIITTIAGTGTGGYSGDGPATAAKLYNPWGVAVDQNGNIYVTDQGNHRIRKINANGIITTIAGTGVRGYNGDGGPAIEAILNDPEGVAIDSGGNIYIVDTTNQRIRKITAATAFASAEPGDMTFAEEGFGYVFSLEGKHKQTIDLDTQKIIEQFGYDSAGRLVTLTDLFNNQIKVERDSVGVPIAITSPDGVRTSLTIDSNNHLKQITYPDGHFYKFDYTPGGLLTTETEPKGNFFTHIFDTNGRITDVSDQEGGHEQFARQVQTNNGDVTTTLTSGEGDMITYLDQTAPNGTWTSTSSVSGVTKPTIFTRTTDEMIIKVTFPDLTINDFQFAHDPENNFKYLQLETITTPSGLKAQIVFNRTYTDTNIDKKTDLITRTASLNGKTSTFTHNILTSTLTATSPLGRTKTVVYDPATLLTATVSTPGLLDTTYKYDLKGRMTEIHTGSRSMIIGYDSDGNVESVKDPRGNLTRYEYDANGRTKVIHRPGLTDVRFDYDANGNLTVLTNPSSQNHGYIYNNVNLPTSYTPPISPATQYVYDKERRLKEVDFPSGKQIKNIYTKVQLTQVQTPEGNTDLSYFPSGQLESVTKGSESITNTYDGSLLKTVTSAGTLAQALSFGYDNDLKITGLTYAGTLNNFGYDNDGLLTSSGRFIITHNPQNGLPTAVSGGALSLSRAFANGYGEVTNQTQTVNSTAAGSWTLTYNDNGQIATKSETVAGITSNYVYTYDSMGRLTNVEKDGTLVEEYRYTGANPLGTRTYEMNSLRGIAGRSLAYNVEDQLLSVGSATYEYNTDGFLFRKKDGSSTTTYNYSSRGELLSASLPDGRLIEYVYDPMGRRIAKKINGSIVEKYLWSGLTGLLAVYDGSNNLLMRFEYSDSIVPNAMTKGSATYYLSYDQVGSLRSVSDSTGTIVKRIDYDSFGNILVDTAPTFTVPFGFAGGLHDRDVALVHFGFRDYDPATGRWTAKDPIGFNGGDVDFYGYVLNDPVNWVDPWGLQVGLPPVPVPGDPHNSWRWNPDPNNSRGGSYGPKTPLPNQGQPSASWDAKGNHWDVDDGKGSRQRYDTGGKPLTPEEAHKNSNKGGKSGKFCPLGGAAAPTEVFPLIIVNPCLIFPEICGQGAGT